jgi:hypothetical protein
MAHWLLLNRDANCSRAFCSLSTLVTGVILSLFVPPVHNRGQSYMAPSVRGYLSPASTCFRAFGSATFLFDRLTLGFLLA